MASTVSDGPQIAVDPIRMLRPRRRIVGHVGHSVAVRRMGKSTGQASRPTSSHGQCGAGAGREYGHRLCKSARPANALEVLRQTQAALAGRPFVAGAFVGDKPGSRFDRDAYSARNRRHRRHRRRRRSSFSRMDSPNKSTMTLWQPMRLRPKRVERFIGFELGSMFAPFGKIYSLDVYRALVRHSAVHRGEALVAPPRARMATAGAARCRPPGLSDSHRQRSGHRHGDVRQRLFARLKHVRSGRVCPARCASGRG